MQDLHLTVAAIGPERGRQVLECRPVRAGGALSVGDALAALAGDRAFRDALRRTLAAAPLRAFFWETPPYTRAGLRQPWAFVLVDAPMLDGVPAEPRAFAEHYAPGQRAVAFPNLGGDAWLVAPCAGPDAAHCAHLADFTRGVEEDTQDAFWRLVGETALARAGDRPVWLSTCGTGVYWLHARLDSYPKYYSHDPYRRAQP